MGFRDHLAWSSTGTIHCLFSCYAVVKILFVQLLFCSIFVLLSANHRIVDPFVVFCSFHLLFPIAIKRASASRRACGCVNRSGSNNVDLMTTAIRKTSSRSNEFEKRRSGFRCPVCCHGSKSVRIWQMQSEMTRRVSNGFLREGGGEFRMEFSATF